MAFEIMPWLGVASAAGNLGQTILGSRMSGAGAQLQAGGYRQAASSTIAAAEYNNQILEFNTQRRLDALGRQIRRVGSEQRAAAASSGFASTSRSKLAVMDATLDQSLRQIQQEVVSLGHQQQANLFEARSRATALETQARQVEFTQSQRRQGDLTGILSSAGTLLDSIGGLFDG
jgi:replicative DNA helicase